MNDRTPDAARSAVPERRTARLRRRMVVVGAAAVLLAAVGVWLTVSDVAIPDERYSSAPDPCKLVTTATVQRLIGTASGTRTDPEEAASWGPPFSRPEQAKRCTWRVDPDENLWGEVEVRVEVFFGTKFGLGRSGAEKAETIFTSWNSTCANGPEQVYEHTGDLGYACASSGDARRPTLALQILQDNLFVIVRAVPQRPPALAEGLPWDPAETASSLAEEVHSQLGVVA